MQCSKMENISTPYSLDVQESYRESAGWKSNSRNAFRQPGQEKKRDFFDGYNWLEDTITWTAAQTKNSATFINVIEGLLVKRYPTGWVVLVLDNAFYHKSAFGLAPLTLFEHRVMIIWLLPYCSDLNLIERFWRFLQDRACANKLEANIGKVKKNSRKNHDRTE